MFNLYENDSTPINDIIGTVNATDIDGNLLIYTVENVTNSPVFEALSDGQIQFKGPSLLDYEDNIK